jgi:hypothetical protein
MSTSSFILKASLPEFLTISLYFFQRIHAVFSFFDRFHKTNPWPHKVEKQ